MIKYRRDENATPRLEKEHYQAQTIEIACLKRPGHPKPRLHPFGGLVGNLRHPLRVPSVRRLSHRRSTGRQVHRLPGLGCFRHRQPDNPQEQKPHPYRVGQGTDQAHRRHSHLTILWECTKQIWTRPTGRRSQIASRPANEGSRTLELGRNGHRRTCSRDSHRIQSLRFQRAPHSKHRFPVLPLHRQFLQ